MYVGIDMDQLWSDLGVASDAVHVPSDRLIKIYHDYMGNVEQECLANLEELLLERHDIFDPNISEAEMITRVSEELKVRLYTCKGSFDVEQIAFDVGLVECFDVVGIALDEGCDKAIYM